MTRFEKIILEKFEEDKCPRAHYICEHAGDCDTCTLHEQCKNAKADNEIEEWLKQEVD